MQIARDRSSFLLFSFFLSIFVLTNQGSIQTSDGTSMFLVTKNIVEKHSLALDPLERRDLIVKGKGDKYYSKYGLGTSILAIPFYLTGKIVAQVMGIPKDFVTKFFVSLMGAFITAMMCVFVFKLSLKMGFPLKISFMLPLIYGLGTMAWVYSEDLYSTTIVNLFLFIAVYFIYDFREGITSTQILFSGIMMGLAILARYDALIIMPILVVYIVIKIKKQNVSLGILLKKNINFWHTNTVFFISCAYL